MSDKYFTSPQRFEFMRSMRQKGFDNKQMTEKELEHYNKLIDQYKLDDSMPGNTEEASLETDLRISAYISNKCKASEIYSQNLYAALCNNEFVKNNQAWSCSWRSAGGIVANLREEGDYIDWYCSGIGAKDGCVGESFVTEEVRTDITDLGWSVIEYPIGEDI